MPTKSRNRRSPKRLARRMKPTRQLSRRKGSGKKGSARARNPKKMRGGVTRKRLSQLTQQELLTALEELPVDVVKQIGKRHPLLIPPFTNHTLRRAVQDYLAGGARKKGIVKKYGEINNWDVSKVTGMDSLFSGSVSGAQSFNQPLNNWNVSKVTDMAWMFFGASSFNQPLNNWGVSNVTNMSYMFHEASSFNQPLNNWDVSNVTTMSSMFLRADSFNQPLDKWNVSKVTYMECMFLKATSFNQSLNKWNVSNVRDMESMFRDATSFNQPLHAPWYHEESEDEYDWTDSESE
jgi:surface protein